MKRLQWWAILLLKLLCVLPCVSQVFRVAGGVGNLQSSEGGSVGMYQADSTTTLSAGSAQGFRLGARREVSAGNNTLAVGDTNLQLPLPTDIESTPRTFTARGVLLQSDAGHGTALFAGYTGANYANAYLNTVASTRFFSLAATQLNFGRVKVFALQTKGESSNTLLSVSAARNALSRFALTTGQSGGHAVFRCSTHQESASFRVDAGFNAGTLKLQPDVDGQAVSLERTGLNVIASKRIGQWLTLDGARHVYATADAGNSALYHGVTAARSQLLEAGANVQFGPVHLQSRLLRSQSGTQGSSGDVWLGVWTSRLWSAQALLVRNRDSTQSSSGAAPQGDTTRTVSLQAAQEVYPRLRLEQTLNLGSGSTAVSFGGSWEGDRMSLSVTNRQTFVPFGDARGFHSVMAMGLRLRLGNGEIAAAVTRGGNLPATVVVSTESYYGAFASEGSPAARTPRLPRFMVQGIVLDAARKPVRGAALRVDNQVVFTDSAGHFTARLQQGRPVAINLVPDQFLTAQPYRAVTKNLMVKPTEIGEDVTLEAEVCHTCNAAPAAVLADSVKAVATPSLMARTTQSLWHLVKRMVHWKEAHPETPQQDA